MTGVSDSGIRLSLASNQTAMLTRGESAALEVALDRTVVGDIQVSIEGLPSCIAVEPVVVPISSNGASLNLVLASTCEQGALKTATIVAHLTSNPSLRSTLAFSAFVRGRRGELDTTFGSAGALQLPSDGTAAVDIDPKTSKLYAHSSGALYRYSADGIIEPDFPVTFAPTTLLHGLTIRNDRVYLFDYSHTERRTLDGALDANFATAGALEGPTENPNRSLGANVPVWPDGSFVLPREDFYVQNYTLSFFTPAGQPDSARGTSGTATGALNHSKWGKIAPVGDGLFFVTGTTGTTRDIVGKLKLPAASADPRFGGAGTVTLTGKWLFDLAQDKSGYLTVAGYTQSSNAFYMARLDASGIIDPSLAATVSDVVSNVSLALDGSDAYVAAATIAAGASTHCVLFRLDRLGQPIATFGANGRSELSSLGGCNAATLLRYPDGRILVGDSHFVARVWD